MRALGIELAEDAPSTSHYVFDAGGQIIGFFGRAFRSCGEARAAAAKPGRHN